jgi:hypothetical protein
MMYYGDAEILYPARVTPCLRDLRGEGWQELVDWVLSHSASDDVALAFGLLMIRLDGCLTCHADSYRAMRGCAACARQAVSRYKGTDADLWAAFEQALCEIVHWRETGETSFSEQWSGEVQ